MHSTHLVLSKESGQEVVKIWWNLVTSVCKSGRLVLQLHWASTSSQLDLPPTKTESFVPVPGAKDPGAWLEHRSTFGVPGLPCHLVAVKAWKTAELLYLKSGTFQTYQNSPIKNSPLPRNVRIWCCKSSTKTSWDRSQRVPEDSACVKWVTNMFPLIELQSQHLFPGFLKSKCNQKYWELFAKSAKSV